jgi:hypothetical protein
VAGVFIHCERNCSGAPAGRIAGAWVAGAWTRAWSGALPRQPGQVILTSR